MTDDLKQRGASTSAAIQPVWKPIETAPKDGSDVIVGFDVATVWVVHSAWWLAWDDEAAALGFQPEDEGWWSCTRGSVAQEKLGDYRTPTHWLCAAGPNPKFADGD